ncbi:MAG: HAD-IB family hydrolase [Gammaproteobacteria bacterium]|nr:HAD-IB family hydrolase [Gammaproteobacteria bacterium]
MSLAIFDLDNTLLAGDSDVLWGQFLVEKGVVDENYYSAENQRFYDEYNNGTLDIFEFLAFSLKPLSENPVEELNQWHKEFMQRKIQSILLPKAFELIAHHKQKGDTLLIITATNRFVTAPIAELLGVPHLLATDPEQVDGNYTGKVAGVPCFQEGKVTRLNTWLTENDENLTGSCFYSDSHNDLPLLKLVNEPVAVDADKILQEYAAEHNWKTMSLR